MERFGEVGVVGAADGPLSVHLVLTVRAVTEEIHEILERLERARIPFAPLRRPDQLVDDPHLNAARQFVDTPLPGRGTAKLPKMPVRSTAFEFGLRRPAPGLGEHTREVLQESGLSKDEIDALASRRVIG